MNSTIPFIISKDRTNTHRAVKDDGYHRFYDIQFHNPDAARRLDLMVERMLIDGYEWGMFNLNEFPYNVMMHRTFIDIDANIDDLAVSAIKNALEELIDGPADIRVLRNCMTGKIHMTVGAPSSSIEPVKKRAILHALRDYLYEFIEGEMTREEWDSAFDVKAMGIRAAFGRTISPKGDAMQAKGWYVPCDIPESHADYLELAHDRKYRKMTELVVRNSIYYPFQGMWTAEAFAMFEAQEIELLGKKSAAEEKQEELIAKAEYDTQTNTIPVFGENVPVSAELVSAMFEKLPLDWAKGHKWSILLGHIHAIWKDLNKANHEYFLHEWSARVAAEYNRDGNLAKWHGLCAAKREVHGGASLTWLRDLAMNHVHARNHLREFLNRLPNILDPTCLKSFDDLAQHDGNIKALLSHLYSTMAWVSNGGRSLWITKRIIDGKPDYSFILCGSAVEKSLGKRKFRTGIVDDPERTLAAMMELVRKNCAYSRVDFVPYFDPKDAPKDVFNMFTGYAFSFEPEFEIDPSKITRILNHIREVWSRDDQRVNEYVLKWFAHIIQKPTHKMGTAILLKSVFQGAGKNIICEFIGKMILGKRYSITLTDVDQLISRFNSPLENKLLTICDEISNYGGAHRSNDKLKSLITQTEMQIERKGVDAQTVHDFNNYVFLTNNDWALKIEATDRRYLTLDLANKYANDATYFAPLLQEINSTESAKHFFHYLATLDISDWNPRDIPMTSLKRELKMNSVALPVRYLIELRNGEAAFPFGDLNEGEHKITTDALYQAFTQWAEAGGNHDQRYNKIAFGREISKIIAVKTMRLDGAVRKGIQFTKAELEAALCANLKLESTDELSEM